MTVTNNVVILHTPKTAGSSVRWPAVKVDGFQYSCQHCKYESLPDQYKDMRKITFVRNPYDWYASRYFFDKKRYNETFRGNHPKGRNDVFSDIFSDKYKRNFNETLPYYMNLTKTFQDEKMLKALKKELRYQVMNHYQCWLVSYFDNISTIKAEDFENKSLYQWWLDIIGVQHADAIYRAEDQHEEGMKKEFGPNVNIVRRNVTGRKDNELIYRDEDYKLVYETDKNIFEKYGYEEKI